MRALFPFMFFLLTVSCTSCAVHPEPKLPTSNNYGVARLVIKVDGEDHGWCTVWKIQHGMALTAGHCCVTPEQILAEREEQEKLNQFFKLLDDDSDDNDTSEDEAPKPPQKLPVIEYTAVGHMALKATKFKVLRDDDSNDVCVLQGEMAGLPITLASHDPVVGEQVWTEGYPKGIFLISSGYWSGMADPNEMAASVAVWGGASGSPVMNANGEAVALLNAYMPPMSNLTFMVPLEWLVANVASATRTLDDESMSK